MMDIKEGLLLWFTNFLIKSRQAAMLIVNIHANNEHPLDLTEELHKAVIRKC